MTILDTILTNTYTIQDLHHRVRILKSQIESSLFGKLKIEELTPEDSAWLTSLPPTFINQFTQDNIYAYFNQLEEQTKNLNPLVIYLSFEPGPEQIEALGLWIKKNLSQIKLFETKIDPSLLGGVALVNSGVYKDYSLKSRIEQQGETILTEFKKYIR